MGKQGWLTIRNVPDIPSQPGENGHFNQLTKFFESHCLCPRCKGKGSKQKKDGPLKPETTIRFGGIEELEKLNGMDGVSMTDIIRDILERRCFTKRPCIMCHGSRFVKKETAEQYLKGKKRGETKGKKTAKGKKAHKAG